MPPVRNGLGRAGAPSRLVCSTGLYGINRSSWGKGGAFNNFYAGEATVVSGASIADTAARPNGYEPPYSWIMARRGGGLSAYNSMSAGHELSGGMSLGINLDSTMTADGTITTANLSLVVSLACTMLAECAVTASMQAIASLASTMVANNDLSGALSAIAFMVSTMTANGSLDGSTMRGTAHMSALMTTEGSVAVLTAAEIAAAVWADLAALALTDEVSLVRKTTGNRLQVDFVTQRLNLYDDDGVTILRYWPLATDGGEPVTTASGVQTKRLAPVG